MSFKGFSIFSSDGHFVQRSGTILAILVKELQGNICVKLFWNWSSSLGGDVLWMNCWRHTTDDGHRVITIAHLEHLVLRWAKKYMVLVLCKLSNHALYLYEVSWKYLKGFQSYSADTISYIKIFKEARFHRKYRWSYDPCSQHIFWSCFILYKVSWKYLKGFQSYGGTWFPIFKIFKGAQFCKKCR